MKTDLLIIPNVGRRTKEAMMNIGISCVEDLIGQDPEDLYVRDCLKKGFQEDRCALYVFRMAVYYAEHTEHDEEKLKWWYWKDQKSIDIHHASPMMAKIIELREKYDLHMKVERYVSDEAGVTENDKSFIKD